MINEERVRELFQMAVFDEREEKKCRPMGQYYMWDYVGKELVKSFFSGTIAFVLLVVLWGISDLTALTAYINGTELANLAIRFIVLYVAFMAVYLIVTAAVYCIRYDRGRRKLRKYVDHMKKVRKIYQRESRLKA
ncbi:MAG: hypothetical protein PUA77_01730 [Lachnospiraceae bacterium]|nr:hypothetical protein [Lachnospiraceae bacterium]